jgi:hypothetical protein
LISFDPVQITYILLKFFNEYHKQNCTDIKTALDHLPFISVAWMLSKRPLESARKPDILIAPSEKGFEESFSLIEGGANHFTYEPVYPGGHVTFMHNQDIVERPTNMTYSNDLCTNNLINSIKKYQEDGNPLFMYLSFQVGHTPFQAPQEHVKKYEQIYDSGWNEIRQQRFEKQKELGIWPANMTFPRGYRLFLVGRA